MAPIYVKNRLAETPPPFSFLTIGELKYPLPDTIHQNSHIHPTPLRVDQSIDKPIAGIVIGKNIRCHSDTEFSFVYSLKHLRISRIPLTQKNQWNSPPSKIGLR